jgi:transcription elongation factor GreA
MSSIEKLPMLVQGYEKLTAELRALRDERPLIVFGATVTLLDDDDKPVRYQIVGPYEADAKGGKISYNSPLGRALIGKKVGEELEVSVPAGERFYAVEKIEFI